MFKDEKTAQNWMIDVEKFIMFLRPVGSVIAEILLSRYHFFPSYEMITHVTTNLNSNEIETMYGLRVKSRCREIFTLIAFYKTTTDKRK